MEKKNKGPKNTYRAGGVSATVWENTANVKGENVVFETVVVERSYKDKAGQWQKTNSFRSQDLPKVMLVAQQAYKELVMKQKEEEE